MKLVVGLGNPGQKYRATRHNIGFDVVAELARRHCADPPRMKYEAECCEVRINNEKVLLAAPQTYMNLSGKSVRQFVDFYQLDLSSIVVICDDMNLDCGRLRWRAKGSAGGQNGLRDIIRHCGSQEFPRLRVGIGRPPGRMKSADFVLSRFRDEEKSDVELAVVTAADSVDLWVRDGLAAAMNRYNSSPEKKDKSAASRKSKKPSPPKKSTRSKEDLQGRGNVTPDTSAPATDASDDTPADTESA